MSAIKLAIIGGGRFGRSLAKAAHISNIKPKVFVWSRNKKDLKEKQKDMPLPIGINVSNSIKKTVENANVIIVSVKSSFVRESLKNISKNLLHSSTFPIIAIASKGLADGKKMFFSQIAEEIFPSFPIAILSGPSFSEEILNNVYTEINAASANTETCQQIKNIFHGSNITVKACNDIIGLQFFGAVKNLMAIRMGFEYGMIEASGYNPKHCVNQISALFATMAKEVNSMAIKLGSNPQTILEVGGIGDMVLTCFSQTSRNMSFGVALGKSYNGTMPIEEKNFNKAYKTIMVENNAQPLVEGCYVAQKILPLCDNATTLEGFSRLLINVICNNNYGSS